MAKLEGRGVKGGEPERREGDPDQGADGSPDGTIGRAPATPVTPGLEPTAPYPMEAGLDASVGAEIGRYVVRRIVGTGGMGVVVAANDPELGRMVAIKLVAGNHGEPRARLVREARAMARVSHPNVVTVHEVLRLHDRDAIVMELVEGENLAVWREAQPRSWREIVSAYAQAARGLAAAHRAGLVHRDFKPSNALIDRDGVVRVTDFGLVRTTTSSDGDPAGISDSIDEVGTLELTLTKTGAVLGTPAYMAPEQHSAATVDARTDQWALGCSLYTALYGRRPFTGDTYGELSAAVLTGNIHPEPSDTEVPRPIRAAIRRAMALRPADRFATMDDLVAALSPGGRRWKAVAAVAATAMVGAAAVLFMARGSEGPTCTGLGAPMASIWSAASSGPVRAVLMSKAGYGEGAADRVIAALNGYGARWAAARIGACTQARQGAGSPELLDRRMRCLDQRKAEVSQVVSALDEAEPAVIRNAAAAVDQLHPIGDCDDPHEALPLPADPRARQEIAAAEQLVARGWALHGLGQFDQAMQLAAQAAPVGERTGWLPLLARALVLRGECETREGNPKDALDTLDRATKIAAQARDDKLLVEAMSSRFFVLGEKLGRPADALAGRKYIELALERAGQPKRERGLWLHELAVVLIGQGKYDEALAAENEALAIWRETLPPHHVNMLSTLTTIGNIQTYRGELDEADKLLNEGLAARIEAEGPGHPDVAAALTNLGVLEIFRGNTAKAIEYWERAVRIERAAGITSWIGPYNLGLTYYQIGRWRDAEPHMAAALAGAEKLAPGETRSVAVGNTGVGSVQLMLGRHEQAASSLARAVAAARAAGSPNLTEALGLSALLSLAQGDVAAARTHHAEAAKMAKSDDALIQLVSAELTRLDGGCRAARPAYERAAATGAATKAMLEQHIATAGLGECLLELGAAADAVAALEPAITWLDEMRSDPAAGARARFALARALVASRGDRDRARSLAEEARRGFDSLGKAGTDRAAGVARWLARERLSSAR